MRYAVTQTTMKRALKGFFVPLLFFVSLLISQITPAVVHAADCNTAEGGLNLADCYTVGIGETTTVQSLFATPADLINLIIQNLVALSGLFLLFLFIFAGFQYISDTSKGKDRAREILTNALYGVIVMFCAYWIVQIALFVTGMQTTILG